LERILEKSPLSRKDSGENSNPTTKSQYKAGIIGLGFIGLTAPDSHAQAYVDCERTDLIGMCDKAPKFKGEFRHYMDMVKRENLDIVSVCTPVETHCKIVCDIAPHVKAIYCEKPMASTLEECDKMIEVCAKNDTILQINHQRRFVKPLFRFSRDLMDTGTHVFDWLNHHQVDADIEYVNTQEHIFELVVTRKRMILAGVNFLVDCLDTGLDTISSGFEGKEALRLILEFKEWYERNQQDIKVRHPVRVPSYPWLPEWWEICP